MARAGGPIVVCVINLKGGVGKSTISALLARRAFTYKNLDVLAIDLDPQANLSQGLLHARYNAFLQRKDPSIVEIFNGYIPPAAAGGGPTPMPSAGIAQMIAPGANHSLELLPSRFDFSDTLLGAVRPNPRMLAQHLSAHYSQKDLIIVDCAPTESILTTAAYHCSRKVLVPVKPEYFATIGFPLLNQSLDNFRKANRAHTIDVCGVVVNNPFYNGGNDGGPEKAAAMIDIQTEAAKNSWPIYHNQIPHSRGFPKLMRGNYSYQGNADLFPLFANEFFTSIGL